MKTRMHHLAILVLGMLMVTKTFCQSPEQIVRQIEANSTEYYFGHGYAADYDKAVQIAKAQLVSDITTYIQVITDGKVSTEDGVSIQERILTYTNMTQLRDVATVAVKAEPDDFHVFCYLTRSAVQRMFEERKQKMMNFLEDGRQAERQLKLTDALQSYYWAYLILRTLPDDGDITIVDEGVQKNLGKWLKNHIREIVDGVQFNVAGVMKEDDWNIVDVKVTYEGKPVANCDYKYWTGLSYSPITRAKDGHGIAEFNEVPKQIQFYVEYVFETESQNLDAELRAIVTNIDKPSFKNTHVATTTKVTPMNPQSPTVVQNPEVAPSVGNSYFTQPSQSRVDSCSAIMAKVQNAVQSKNPAAVRSLFTDDGYAMFEQMMKNGNATIVRKSELSYIQTPEDVICRSLPMCFKFACSGKTVVENVTFRMDVSSLKIKSLSFGLGQEALNDIMDSTKTWEDRSRMELMKFLEDYQTAYSLKRADFLENIFSEDALIIVGSKLKKAPAVEKTIQVVDPNLYEYTRKTKAEYISALRRVFASSEFVNLQLKDNQILKAPGKEIYGIQIRQMYASNSYADQGYLFLVVDLRNPDRPIIHVRTWQPDKDPNFGLFDLSRFSGI